MNSKYRCIDLESEADLFADFYTLFYRRGQPIYYRKEYNNRITKKRYQEGGFVDSAISLFDLLNSRSKLQISTWSKNTLFDSQEHAVNSDLNARCTRFFVIDIDSDYQVDEISAKTILEALEVMGLYDFAPAPSSVVASGGGFHLYFLIDEIYLTDNIDVGLKEKLLTLYNDAQEGVKLAYTKALIKLKNEIKLNYWNNLILQSLKVDNAVKANTQQLIRAPLSWNQGVQLRSKIIYINSTRQYLLSELVKDYPPLQEEKQKKIIRIFDNRYTKEQDNQLNLARFNDLFKLVDLRKENGNLIGTRQKIMIQAAWLLINIEDNGGIIDPETKLNELGKEIGGEFSSKKYTLEKLKHAKQYYKKRKKLKNTTIIEWLEMQAKEVELMEALIFNSRELKRAKKRAEKQARKEEAIKYYYENGENKTATADIYGVSARTIYSWIKEYEKEQEEKRTKRNIKGQISFKDFDKFIVEMELKEA